MRIFAKCEGRDGRWIVYTNSNYIWTSWAGWQRRFALRDPKLDPGRLPL